MYSKLRLVNALHLLILVYLATPTSTAISNRTIDDTLGDSATGQQVTYFSPPWQVKTCVHCMILPDVAQMFDNTYHALTYHADMLNMSVQMEFVGTAVYVFFTLVNQAAPEVTTNTITSFVLDSNEPHPYRYISDPTLPQYMFRSLVFKKENLDNVKHVLQILTTGSEDSYVNFDYALYTNDDETSTTQTLSPTKLVPEASAPSKTRQTTSPSPSNIAGSDSSSSIPSSTDRQSGKTASLSSAFSSSESTRNTTTASASPVTLAKASGPRSGTLIGIVSGTVVGGLLVLGGTTLLLLRLFAQKRRTQKSPHSVMWPRRYSNKRTRPFLRIFRENPQLDSYEAEVLPARRGPQTVNTTNREETERDLDIEEIRDMLFAMRRQLGYLQRQQHSQDHGQAPPHEPPPEYTVSA